MSQVELCSTSIDKQLPIYVLKERSAVWRLHLWQLIELLPRWWPTFASGFWSWELAASEHACIEIYTLGFLWDSWLRSVSL